MSGESVVTAVTGEAQALWYTGCGSLRNRACVALEECRPGDVRIKTLFSGISRGTEGLVSSGARFRKASGSACARRTRPATFPFRSNTATPMSAGCWKGIPGLVGRTVFSLYPHQSDFTLPSKACVPVPDGVPANRAVLAGQHGNGT